LNPSHFYLSQYKIFRVGNFERCFCINCKFTNKAKIFKDNLSATLKKSANNSRNKIKKAIFSVGKSKFPLHFFESLKAALYQP